MTLPRLLLVLVVLTFTGPLWSAPAPVKTYAVPPLERYLLDDTDCVAIVNVKQIVASPMFAKHFKKKLETLLASAPFAPFLKGTGVDLLTDVDRIVLVLGKSCHSEKPGTEEGPVLLVQGRFNPAVLHQKMTQLAKDMPKVVTLPDDKTKVYMLQLGSGEKTFAAILDRSTVMIAGRKEHVLTALAKAAGTKRTTFANKAVPVALKTLKPDLAVQAFGLEETIVNSTHTPNGRKQHTMGESGFRGFTVRVAVKDDIRATVELSGKNKDAFEKSAKQITEGFDFIKPLLKQQIAAKQELAPLGRALDGLKITKANDSLHFEGVLDAAGLQALIDASTMRPKQ
jgi:hypothetical protein